MGSIASSDSDHIANWTHDDVVAVHERIRPYIRHTPLVPFETPEGTDHLLLKVESFQKTGSFKVRGAIHALSQLTPAERTRGVVTASSGSHGKAVAYAAGLFNTQATIVLPENPNPVKRQAIADYGANIVLEPGPSVAQIQKAHDLAQEKGLTFVHAFNTPEIFLGQGTVGLEIVQDFPNVKRIVTPIGGGGLAAGLLTALKQTHPHIEIIGVQPEGCCALYDSLQAGKITSIPKSRTIAEGLTSTCPEEPTFSIIQQYIDDVVIVSDSEIEDAVAALAMRGRVVAEPSGAAATAAVLSGKVKDDGRPTVLIISGGNVETERLLKMLKS